MSHILDMNSHIKFTDDHCWRIDELNQALTRKFNGVLNDFSKKIKIQGEIVDCKVFRNNSGISFKIKNNKSQFKCKAWASNVDIDKIKVCENTTCTLVGRIQQDNFFGFDFILIVNEIEKDNNESKLKQLKKECEMKEYFINKKPIEWQNVKKIGIISKKETQGYNDFITQFKIPLHITTTEISLEGAKTEKDIINAIQILENKVDIIMIIRGGGATMNISNSFDKISIFKSIKESKVPVITAIGHEADKDDKLLITNISDYDYSTPTRAAIELNNIFINPKLNNLREYSDKLTSIFRDNSEKERKKEYLNLECIISKIFGNKFGCPVFKVDTDDPFIIIQKDDKFYKNTIIFTEPIDITIQDIELKKLIEEALFDEDINIIKSNISLLSEDVELNELINKTIMKIETLDKKTEKFEKIKKKNLKSLYLKNYNLENHIPNKKLQQLKGQYLWYINILENIINENTQDINHIYKFC